MAVVMRLVDAEVTQNSEPAPDAPLPPRPARRRVYASLLVTLSVLVGTVTVIYSVFPNRQNEILTTAIETYLATEDHEIVDPTGNEVRAWAMGVLKGPAPWPEAGEGLTPISANSATIFKRNLALVRYRIRDANVGLAFIRAQDVPPRLDRRTEDGLYAVSWRVGRFTAIAVGPANTKAQWAPRLGVP